MMKMLVTPSALPKEYYVKHLDSDIPTVLVSMPRKRRRFFSTYVEELGDKFNIILYSHALKYVPENYNTIKVKRSLGLLRGFFSYKKSL